MQSTLSINTLSHGTTSVPNKDSSNSCFASFLKNFEGQMDLPKSPMFVKTVSQLERECNSGKDATDDQCSTAIHSPRSSTTNEQCHSSDLEELTQKSDQALTEDPETISPVPKKKKTSSVHEENGFQAPMDSSQEKPDLGDYSDFFGDGLVLCGDLTISFSRADKLTIEEPEKTKKAFKAPPMFFAPVLAPVVHYMPPVHYGMPVPTPVFHPHPFVPYGHTNRGYPTQEQGAYNYNSPQRSHNNYNYTEQSNYGRPYAPREDFSSYNRRDDFSRRQNIPPRLQKKMRAGY